jgi:hypothetical protein
MLQDLPAHHTRDLVIVISVALGPGKLLFLPGDWFFEPPHHLTPIHADAPQGLSARSEADFFRRVLICLSYKTNRL